MRDIAEIIGRHLGIRAASVSAEKATEHFGPFGMVMPPAAESVQTVE